MEIMAKTRFARVSTSKARDFIRRLQGLPAAKALELTQFSKRKVALVAGKTLKSAIANAKNNNDLTIDDLIVKEAIVDEGPSMRRYWPRPRGSVSPIRRRMSHVKIVLSNGSEDK